jgi:hypothetical protein
MKLEDLRKIEAKATEGPWRVKDKDYFPSVIGEKDLRNPYGIHICELMSYDLCNAEVIAAMRNHFKALLEVAEVAKSYKKYLPNMERIGAAKYSAQLDAAMELREALAKLEQIK